MADTIRKIIDQEKYYILPLSGLVLEKFIFYQPSGQNMIVLELQQEDYHAGFTLEVFDLYDLHGNIISNLDVYINSLQGETCINALAHKTGILEINFEKHKFLVNPDPNYESWSFWDSNNIKIYCLARGDLMTFGVQ